jgi:7-cyano-7-deazaguanine synthase
MGIKKVLLFSGGLDSFIAWRLLDHPQPLYLRLGHAYEREEIASINGLEQQVSSLCVLRRSHLNLTGLYQQDGHVPVRNLLLASVAVAETGASTVYLGALRGESSPDKSAQFFRAASHALSVSEGRPITLAAPFHHLTKTGLVAAYLRRYPNETHLLGYTRSCYTSSALPCGQCMACFRRWVAMSLNGIHENYANPPWRWQTVQSSNRAEWWNYLRKANPWEWGGILANNLDAWRAMRRAERV